MMILRVLIDGYSLVVLASVILSWIRLDPENPIVRVVDTLTEPVLGRIRKILPDFGGIDFSPMILLLVLRFVRGLLGP
jgi:YggT family protein